MSIFKGSKITYFFGKLVYLIFYKTLWVQKKGVLMFTFLCPYCNTKTQATANAIHSLPPTGGDYQWQESDKIHQCHSCQENFSIRVRTEVETGALLKLLATPKPQKDSIIWYVVAKVEQSYQGAQEEKKVRVSVIFQEEEVAKRKLSGSFQVLKVTKAGYYAQEGENPIVEASYEREVINYSTL